jgi:hypothetical protein
MPLECFIAMAFGQPDTDSVYDRSIRPVLRQRGITPFRVDRSVRNDDVDDQILAGLQRCDLVIADLTYARPSVYFEAGVAHGRQVPVIFTCRTDHFGQRPDDSHGNFRVHFDLQMKPIISWGTPDEPRFAKRLARRVDHVTRPLLKHREATALEKHRLAEFASIPLQEKLSRLACLYRTTCKRHGYKECTEYGGASLLPPRSRYLKWCHARFFNTLSRNELIAYTRFRRSEGLYPILKEAFEVGRLPKRASRNIILCSLQRVSAARVAAAFPESSIHTDNGLIVAKCQTATHLEKYSKSRSGEERWGNMITAIVPTDVTIAVISGLKHPQEFRTGLEKVLS